MKGLVLFLSLLMASSVAFAYEVRTQTIDYKAKDVVLEGYLAVPQGVEGKVPGVLVVHDWYGLKDPYKEIANRLAQLGYVAFAADIYGKGVRAVDNRQASAEATKYSSDRKLMRERVIAAFEDSRSNPMWTSTV